MLNFPFGKFLIHFSLVNEVSLSARLTQVLHWKIPLGGLEPHLHPLIRWGL